MMLLQGPEQQYVVSVSNRMMGGCVVFLGSGTSTGTNDGEANGKRNGKWASKVVYREAEHYLKGPRTQMIGL